MAYFRTGVGGLVIRKNDRYYLCLIGSHRLSSTSGFDEHVLRKCNNPSPPSFEENEDDDEAILSAQSVKICSRALGQDVYRDYLNIRLVSKQLLFIFSPLCSVDALRKFNSLSYKRHC